MPDLYESDLPRVYDATVEFFDSRDHRYQLSYRLDLDIYFGIMNIRERGVHDVAKAVTEMQKDMRRWTAHFNGLRVYLRDEDAIREEERRLIESEHDDA
jgi:hypothetical protein